MHLSGKALMGIVLVAWGVGALLGPDLSMTGFVSAPPVPASSAFSGIQSAFCPSPTCVSLVGSALDNAEERVDVAMYPFTNPALADALIRAHARGVRVRVLVEKQQANGQYSQHEELDQAGIAVRMDTNPSLMHHKFAVIDEEIVITGSMNWTGNGVGENNENVNVIVSRELNQSYAREFERVWEKGTTRS